MKTKIYSVFALICLLTVSNISVNAQEEESSSPFSVGADVVSSYVWRGTTYAGAALQPSIEFSTGNFAIGAWGSYDFNMIYPEADLYISYGFDFGLSLGITDYFYPGTPYFNYSSPDGSHGFELNAGYEISDFYVSANYIFNEAGGAGTAGSDMYFEVGYAFEYFDVFLGAGDGWHTSTGEFEVCNIGIGTSKEIKISDSFTLPVFGQAILNPQTEQFNIVLGVSF